MIISKTLTVKKKAHTHNNNVININNTLNIALPTFVKGFVG